MRKSSETPGRNVWLEDTSLSLGWTVNHSIRKRLHWYFRNNISGIVEKIHEKYPSVELTYTKQDKIDIISIRRLITIPLLPFIAKELDLSLSWILTGHDIEEPGCLRIPTEEGREFHRHVLALSPSERKIVLEAASFYKPSILSPAKPLQYQVCNIHQNWVAALEDIHTWYELPDMISLEVTNYYGMPPEANYLLWEKQVKENVPPAFRTTGRPYIRRLQHLYRSCGTADIVGLICLMDAAGLPVNLCFQWNGVALYSHDAEADSLTDIFLSTSSEGKETLWALLEGKTEYAKN